MSKVSILGAGAWGTAIALAGLRAGSEVSLWGPDDQEIKKIQTVRQNEKRLPGIELPEALQLTADIEQACDTNIIVLATPAQTIREVATKIAPYIKTDTYIMVAAKGIEVGTRLLMSQVIDEVLPQANVSILSGPSFADEVARGLPTAVTVAAQNLQTAAWLGYALNSDSFRVYTSDDIIGVQLGGALKNVLAIGTGIARGLGLGANAEAAMITRGVAEISRLAYAMGAKLETLNGLAGIGDIVLTCSNAKSRNMSLGIEIGRGRSVSDILKATDQTFEGLATSKSVCALAEQMDVEMPISHMIDQILNHDMPATEAIKTLMQRPMKSELEL